MSGRRDCRTHCCSGQATATSECTSRDVFSTQRDKLTRTASTWAFATGRHPTTSSSRDWPTRDIAFPVGARRCDMLRHYDSYRGDGSSPWPTSLFGATSRGNSRGFERGRRDHSTLLPSTLRDERSRALSRRRRCDWPRSPEASGQVSSVRDDAERPFDSRRFHSVRLALATRASIRRDEPFPATPARRVIAARGRCAQVVVDVLNDARSVRLVRPRHPPDESGRAAATSPRISRRRQRSTTVVGISVPAATVPPFSRRIAATTDAAPGRSRRAVSRATLPPERMLREPSRRASSTGDPPHLAVTTIRTLPIRAVATSAFNSTAVLSSRRDEFSLAANRSGRHDERAQVGYCHCDKTRPDQPWRTGTTSLNLAFPARAT